MAVLRLHFSLYCIYCLPCMKDGVKTMVFLSFVTSNYHGGKMLNSLTQLHKYLFIFLTFHVFPRLLEI